MFAFRSAIRRLFGISIPNVDTNLFDDKAFDQAVIKDLRAALDEAEKEIIMLKFDRTFDTLIAAARKAELIKAIGTIMETYQINGIELVEADEDEEVDLDYDGE